MRLLISGRQMRYSNNVQRIWFDPAASIHKRICSLWKLHRGRSNEEGMTLCPNGQMTWPLLGITHDHSKTGKVGTFLGSQKTDLLLMHPWYKVREHNTNMSACVRSNNSGNILLKDSTSFLNNWCMANENEVSYLMCSICQVLSGETVTTFLRALMCTCSQKMKRRICPKWFLDLNLPMTFWNSTSRRSLIAYCIHS